MVLADRLLVCDIDNTLIGDHSAAGDFASWLEDNRDRVAFGVATGRNLESALGVLARWSIPTPDVMITDVGGMIHYWRGVPSTTSGGADTSITNGSRPSFERLFRTCPDSGCSRSETRDRTSSATSSIPTNGPASEIRRRVRDTGSHATAIYSHWEFLDLLPAKATKGLAVKYLTERWGFAQDRVLVAGDSGNDAVMLKTPTAVVVGNFSSELRALRGHNGIYFATADHARGILEGIDHFGFLDFDTLSPIENKTTTWKGDHQ